MAKHQVSDIKTFVEEEEENLQISSQILEDICKTDCAVEEFLNLDTVCEVKETIVSLYEVDFQNLEKSALFRALKSSSLECSWQSDQFLICVYTILVTEYSSHYKFDSTSHAFIEGLIFLIVVHKAKANIAIAQILESMRCIGESSHYRAPSPSLVKSRALNVFSQAIMNLTGKKDDGPECKRRKNFEKPSGIQTTSHNNNDDLCQTSVEQQNFETPTGSTNYSARSSELADSYNAFWEIELKQFRTLGRFFKYVNTISSAAFQSEVRTTTMKGKSHEGVNDTKKQAKRLRFTKPVVFRLRVRELKDIKHTKILALTDSDSKSLVDLVTESCQLKKMKSHEGVNVGCHQNAWALECLSSLKEDSFITRELTATGVMNESRKGSDFYFIIVSEVLISIPEGGFSQIRVYPSNIPVSKFEANQIVYALDFTSRTADSKNVRVYNPNSF